MRRRPHALIPWTNAGGISCSTGRQVDIVIVGADGLFAGDAATRSVPPLPHGTTTASLCGAPPRRSIFPDDGVAEIPIERELRKPHHERENA